RAVLIGDLLADKFLVATRNVFGGGIGGRGRGRRRRGRSGSSRRRVKSVGPWRRPLGQDARGENARKHDDQKSELARHNRSPCVWQTLLATLRPGPGLAPGLRIDRVSILASPVHVSISQTASFRLRRCELGGVRPAYTKIA